MAARRGAARPAGPAGLLLAPGAGSASDHPSLLAVEAAVAPRPVRRIDFPYRKAGRRAPDRAPVLLAALRAEVETFAAELGVGTGRLVLGGRSMGGRMASLLAAGGGDAGDAVPVAGLVLISYPLHPPGRPDKLRTEHFGRLSVPVLFVSGTRDAFGTPDELTQHARAIAGPVTHVWLEGGAHDLKGRDALVASATAEWLASVVV
jgi:uncharacterized protein